MELSQTGELSRRIWFFIYVLVMLYGMISIRSVECRPQTILEKNLFAFDKDGITCVEHALYVNIWMIANKLLQVVLSGE